MSTTDDPTDPRLTHGIDHEPRDQAETYLVLSEDERARGFVRPLRQSYVHLDCPSGTAIPVTTMGLPIAETYARQPGYYGGTYCACCRMHRPVGPDGEFVWFVNGHITDDRVGA